MSNIKNELYKADNSFPKPSPKTFLSLPNEIWMMIIEKLQNNKKDMEMQENLEYITFKLNQCCKNLKQTYQKMDQLLDNNHFNENIVYELDDRITEIVCVAHYLKTLKSFCKTAQFYNENWDNL